MKISLRYGTSGIVCDLPETPGFQGIWRPKDPPVLADPEGVLGRSLDSPIESPSLREMSRNLENACIVISDITRPVPNTLILPPILQILEDAGLEPERILILIATGIHRPCHDDEIQQLVGPEIVRRYRVVNHDSRRPEEMIQTGFLPGEVPIFINRRYVESDLKILTGFIEPHMWAGYSGGRKAVLPGIASLETLQYMHGPEMIAHPGTIYGKLKGNPFHEAALAVMAQAGADFLVNVTLTADHQVTGIFTGSPEAAHLHGCRFLERFCTRSVEEPLDFIVTTNAGAPLDCNLYQTVKGLAAAAPVVKPGGTILTASACFQGLGSADYVRALNKVDTPHGYLNQLTTGVECIPDQWCVQEACQIMAEHPVWLYTDGLSAETVQRYLYHPVDDLPAAVSKLLYIYGSEARWAVVPDGPMLILGPKIPQT